MALTLNKANAERVCMLLEDQHGAKMRMDNHHLQAWHCCSPDRNGVKWQVSTSCIACTKSSGRADPQREKVRRGRGLAWSKEDNQTSSSVQFQTGLSPNVNNMTPRPDCLLTWSSEFPHILSLTNSKPIGLSILVQALCFFRLSTFGKFFLPLIGQISILNQIGVYKLYEITGRKSFSPPT